VIELIEPRLTSGSWLSPKTSTPPGRVVSVIVTVSERPEELCELYREYSAPLQDAGLDYEFIFVAHPGQGVLLAPLRELKSCGEPITVHEESRYIGDTGLLRIGLREARGEIVLILPAYRQVEASSIVRLLEALDSGADLAVARRWPRTDSLVNRTQNWALHRVIGLGGEHALKDVACGARVARRDLLLQIPLYGDFARFLPLLARSSGFRVEEVLCPQHSQDRRRRLYGPGVYLRRFIDVLGLLFLLRFTDKPLRFFGLIGSALATAGAAILLVTLVQRFSGVGIAGRPLLLVGVLLLVLGIQTFALGLVGEMIVHFHANGRRRYRVKPQVSAT
jgi:hypothetical protein